MRLLRFVVVDLGDGYTSICHKMHRLTMGNGVGILRLEDRYLYVRHDGMRIRWGIDDYGLCGSGFGFDVGY